MLLYSKGQGPICICIYCYSAQYNGNVSFVSAVFFELSVSVFFFFFYYYYYYYCLPGWKEGRKDE